jgi:hypothetical protein
MKHVLDIGLDGIYETERTGTQSSFCPHDGETAWLWSLKIAAEPTHTHAGHF